MKQVLIMRGIPGSGKTTWVRQEQERQPHAVVVSADHYFMDGKTYRFNSDKLAEARNQCLRNFMDALASMKELIIVDNCNLRLTEISPYYRVAEAYGWTPCVVWIHCCPTLAGRRGIHGVPPDTVYKMIRSFDPLPDWMRVEHITPR